MKKIIMSAVIGMAMVASAGAEECGYLTFSSENAFSIVVSNKGWNGTMEYSTNLVDWVEWNGMEIWGGQLNGDGAFNLYFRGITNTCFVYDDYGDYKGTWTLNGTDIASKGNIETILDYTTVMNGEHPKMDMHCFRGLFLNATELVNTPELPAVELSKNCYREMFKGCVKLTDLPNLSGTPLVDYCYYKMFEDCSNIVISTVSKVGKEWSLPANASDANNALTEMFNRTGSEFAPRTPIAGTTYRLTNIKVKLLPEWVTLDWVSRSYSGSMQQPRVAVTNATGVTLVENTDYSKSISESINVGVYKVSVSGINTYTGTIEVPYYITGVANVSGDKFIATNVADSAEVAVDTLKVKVPEGASVEDSTYKGYFDIEVTKDIGNSFYELSLSLNTNKIDFANTINTFTTNLSTIAASQFSDVVIATKPGLYYGIAKSTDVKDGYCYSSDGCGRAVSGESMTFSNFQRPSSTNGFFKLSVSAVKIK